jgi:hypothetical protein
MNLKRVRAAWRNRCRCWQYDGGPYGYNACWVPDHCPVHGARETT